MAGTLNDKINTSNDIKMIERKPIRSAIRKELNFYILKINIKIFNNHLIKFINKNFYYFLIL